MQNGQERRGRETNVAAVQRTWSAWWVIGSGGRKIERAKDDCQNWILSNGRLYFLSRKGEEAGPLRARKALGLSPDELRYTETHGSNRLGILLRRHLLSEVIYPPTERLPASVHNVLARVWAPKVVDWVLPLQPPNTSLARFTFFLKPWMGSISYNIIWGLKTHRFSS